MRDELFDLLARGIAQSLYTTEVSCVRLNSRRAGGGRLGDTVGHGLLARRSSHLLVVVAVS
jgi:hypothetical protein